MKKLENPMKRMPVLVKLWMRANCPTLYANLDELWRDGYMHDVDNADDETKALLMAFIQVHTESAALLAYAKNLGPEGLDAMLSFVHGGAFMAGWNLARELAKPLVWQEAEADGA